MWTYSQSTGALKHNGRCVSGYSGARDLRMISNIDVGGVYEGLHDYGHIPRGAYKIGRSFSAKSPRGVLSLVPVGHDARGRDCFLIHGDYKDKRKTGTASEGCIILPPDVRQAIWDSQDHFIYVTF